MSAETQNAPILFSGSSHPKLGQAIADYLGLQLGEIDISRFSGGEIYARIKENVRGKKVVIVQTTTEKVNEELMELFIIIDALKRASAASITVVIPHFSYARQDRKAASREPISARLIADLLTTAGTNRVITMDIHSDQIQGFFNIPVDTLTAMPLFATYLQEKGLKDVVVVAPDAGRVKVSKKLGDRLGAELAILHKVRPERQKVEVTHIIGEVKDKTVVIVDDMIDTAGTITSGVEVLRKAGCRPDIYVFTTHAIFSGPAVERFKKAQFTEVVAMDSVPIPEAKRFPGLKVLSAAPLLGEAILRNYEYRSISSLFDYKIDSSFLKEVSL